MACLTLINFLEVALMCLCLPYFSISHFLIPFLAKSYFIQSIHRLFDFVLFLEQNYVINKIIHN